MRRRVANYILLIIIITSSFFSICTFDLYPSGPYDKSLDNFRLLAPGVIFSLFISILQRRRFSIGKSILFFCILLVFYSIALVAGMSSYGVGVPFAGGFGALLIKNLFKLSDSDGSKYFVPGFVAGLIGLCLYYYPLKDIGTDGVGFGVILIIWQVVFGLLWIKQTDATTIKT